VSFTPDEIDAAWLASGSAKVYAERLDRLYRKWLADGREESLPAPIVHIFNARLRREWCKEFGFTKDELRVIVGSFLPLYANRKNLDNPWFGHFAEGWYVAWIGRTVAVEKEIPPEVTRIFRYRQVREMQ
jgi:hypothetical protein